jgi:hypothetical protein
VPDGKAALGFTAASVTRNVLAGNPDDARHVRAETRQPGAHQSFGFAKTRFRDVADGQ